MLLTPASLLSALLMALPFATTEPPEEGAVEAAAEAAPLPEAEALPLEPALAFDAALAVADPDCEAAA